MPGIGADQPLRDSGVSKNVETLVRFDAGLPAGALGCLPMVRLVHGPGFFAHSAPDEGHPRPFLRCQRPAGVRRMGRRGPACSFARPRGPASAASNF